MDWKLYPQLFALMNKELGPQEVDTFVIHLSNQFPSWRPDPLAEATDAFGQKRGHLKGYAKPLGGQSPKPCKESTSLSYFSASSLEVQEVLFNFPRQLARTHSLIQWKIQWDLLPYLAMWPISGKVWTNKSFKQSKGTSLSSQRNKIS